MYTCKHCGKSFERKQQLAGHIIWCKNNPNRSGKSNFHNKKYKNDIRPQDEPKDLYCQFCGKHCKNLNSLRQHEVRCKCNPNKIDITNSTNNIKNYIDGLKCGIYTKTNTNQYTKAINLGLPAPTVSDNTRIKLANIWKGKKHTDSSKTKVSHTMQRVVREHPESYSASNVNGRVKKVEYDGNIFDSSWEVLVAKYLDDNNIIWERPRVGFDYEYEGKMHVYYPDFYVPSIDKYIEVKGYKRANDDVKWAAVDNLIVIMDKEIKEILNNNYKFV